MVWSAVYDSDIKRGFRKFCERESNFDNVLFVLVDEGRENTNATISGPSSAR